MYEDARMILPMKIWHLPDDKEQDFKKYADSGDYFAQLKVDGALYIYEKTVENHYLFSRTISAKDGYLVEKGANVPHIMEQMSSWLPNNSIILGEIYYPGKTSKDIVSIMGCLPDKAIKRQNEEYGLVWYYIYDILQYDGIDLTKAKAELRYKILEKLFEKALEKYPLENIKLIPSVYTDIFNFSEEMLHRGEEGVVLKKKKAPYSPDKRPAWDTIKRKKNGDEDVIAIDFIPATKYYDGKLILLNNYGGKDADEWPYWVVEEMELSTGKILTEIKVPIGEKKVVKGINWRTVPVTKGYYKNWYSSIEIGALSDDGEIIKIGTVSSGIDDRTKEQISADKEKFINKTIKVGYMEKDNKEKTLRHPIFIEFRDDKNANECKISDIFH